MYVLMYDMYVCILTNCPLLLTGYFSGDKHDVEAQRPKKKARLGEANIGRGRAVLYDNR